MCYDMLKDKLEFVSEVLKMKIELKKWSFEDKEFLIKMCNTIEMCIRDSLIL